jgi:ABC-type branched-subunit amino acid transport system permease subunit
MVLCAAILGGLSSPRGALLGAALLIGFDNLVAPGIADAMARLAGAGAGGDPGLWGAFSSWRLAIFGVSALFMVDSNGGPTDKLTDQGGYGGLDWTAR